MQTRNANKKLLASVSTVKKLAGKLKIRKGQAQ